MSYNIKKLLPGDFDLAKELFIFFQEDDADPEILIPTEDYLKNLLAKNDFYVIVALQDGKVIGGLTAYELPMYKEMINEVFLYEIGVEPEFRRAGVAAALIDFLKSICREKGIGEMYVGALAGNEPAIKLYANTGGKYEEVAWFVYKL